MFVQIESASLDFLYLGNDDKAFRVDLMNIFFKLDELAVGDDGEYHVQRLVQITTLHRNHGRTAVNLGEYKIADFIRMFADDLDGDP